MWKKVLLMLGMATVLGMQPAAAQGPRSRGDEQEARRLKEERDKLQARLKEVDAKLKEAGKRDDDGARKPDKDKAKDDKDGRRPGPGGPPAWGRRGEREMGPRWGWPDHRGGQWGRFGTSGFGDRRGFTPAWPPTGFGGRGFGAIPEETARRLERIEKQLERIEEEIARMRARPPRR